MPDLRSAAVSAGVGIAGLPWRLRPGRSKPISPGDPHLQRVVIIKPCCMGDLLMSTPAIAALRKALPTSYISLAVGDWSRPAVANNPRVDALIDSPVGGKSAIAADYLKLTRFIRQEHFGAALVFDRSPMLNAAPYLAGVPVRAGLDSGGRGVALTHPVPCPSNAARHEVEWYLDVVRALGLPAPSQEAYLEFYPTDSQQAEARKAIAEAGDEGEGGYVAIHLGGGANPGMRLPAKRWHPRHWARIADWLAETYEATVLLLGGPNAEDRQAAELFKNALFASTRPFVTDLVGKLNWGAMGALIKQCNLFLGHDTGAMHLATAVRTPVVAVFGPSDPTRFGPWDPSGHSIVVAPKRVASDAGALRRAAQGNALYHEAVTAEQVWAAVDKLYSQAMVKA